MRIERLITGSSVLTLVMALAGLALYGWHLAIHPEPRLSDPGEPAPRSAQGVAVLVAVANRHDDDAALRFTAHVHGRDRGNFRRHLRRIAVQRGWYPHGGGSCQRLVVPEADLPELRAVEVDAIDWVRRHNGGSVSANTFREADLVNVVVCVRVDLWSGVLRGLAIGLWALATLPALVFLGDLFVEPALNRRPPRG